MGTVDNVLGDVLELFMLYATSVVNSVPAEPEAVASAKLKMLMELPICERSHFFVASYGIRL